MKNELILIIGLSGSGKDWLADKLSKWLNMKKVVSRTDKDFTRRKNDNSHLYVSCEQADKEFPNAIAKTGIYGARYYTLKEDLIGKDIYVIDEKGVIDIIQVNIPCRIIYINTSIIRRTINMIKRGDKIIDIIKRLKKDKIRKSKKCLIEDFIDFEAKNSTEAFNYIKDLYLGRIS